MNTKITILTGAGASYGCGSVTPYNPPLGKDLYSRLERFAPQVMTEISSIIGRNNIDNFETKMHEIQQSQRINGVIINAMIASYFSQFKPNVYGNAYVDLFKKLNGTQFVYSTLNYDCIAELAASYAGMQINYNVNTIPSAQFDILKIHGSCNFLLGGITGQLGGISMGIANGMIDAPVDVVQPSQVHSLIQNRPAGPCLSFYMKNKPTLVGNSTIKAIQDKWKKTILNSEKIVIIGANVNKDDQHIWDPIASSSAEIGFVGDNTAFSNLQSINSKINMTHLSTDFYSSVSSIVQFVQ